MLNALAQLSKGLSLKALHSAWYLLYQGTTLSQDSVNEQLLRGPLTLLGIDQVAGSVLEPVDQQ